MQMIPLCVCVRVCVCRCVKVQCDVIPCVLVHWTALYYWAHNLHIIYMSSVWHRAIMEKRKKKPSVHICVYERAFLPSSEWMTIQINIKMIVEKQMSRGGVLFLWEVLWKYKICFTVAFPSYSASAVWSWFSFHCSGWYLVSSVWLLRNQMNCNIIATACMQDPCFSVE